MDIIDCMLCSIFSPAFILLYFHRCIDAGKNIIFFFRSVTVAEVQTTEKYKKTVVIRKKVSPV